MLFSTLFLMLSLGVIAGPDELHREADDDANRPLRVEVMTFNIRYGTANDGENHWRHRRRHCIEIIGQRGGDFVGLQEALDFQNSEIRESLRHYGVVGVGRTDGLRRGEHCTILYDRRRWRLDQRENGSFWLSDTPDEPGSRSWGNTIPRIVTWARFTERTTGRGVWVYNTHLDHRSHESRLLSAVMIARGVAGRTRPDEPVIVMGDFNAGENSLIMRYLTGEDEIDQRQTPAPLVDTFRAVQPDAQEVGTFNGFRFGATRGPKIDYILVDPAATVHEAEIIRDHRDERYPSDHFPVTAAVSWHDAETAAE